MSEIRLTPVQYAAELALAWQKGYQRGARDQEDDIEPADNPYGEVVQP